MNESETWNPPFGIGNNMMKSFFLRFKKLHIWFLADFLLLVAFWLLRTCRPLMNALADLSLIHI